MWGSIQGSEPRALPLDHSQINPPLFSHKTNYPSTKKESMKAFKKYICSKRVLCWVNPHSYQGFALRAVGWGWRGWKFIGGEGPLPLSRALPITAFAEPLLQSNTGKSRSKISNHSARKTGITKLLDNNVHPLNVSQLSGHKSLESLKSYYTASRNERKNMSRILSSGEGNGSSLSGGVGVSTQVSSNQNHVNVSSMLSSQSSVSGHHGSTFQGANLTNCTLNVTINNQTLKSPPQLKRKRYLLFSDDEE